MSSSDGYTRSLDESSDFLDEWRGPTAFVRGSGETPTSCSHPNCASAGEEASKSPHPLMLCTGCRGVAYCSRMCQEGHWNLAGAAGHKGVCRDKGFQRSARLLLRLVRAREVEALEELCKSGINVTFTDKNGASDFVFPLANACVPAYFFPEVEAKNQTPARQVATISTLVKYGANVNQRVHPGNGTSSLHIAVQNVQVAAVLRLLQCPGIDVNLRKTSTGCSPIFLSTGMHSFLEPGPHPEQDSCYIIMKALLDAGADPNVHGHDLKCLGSPLMYAAGGRNPKLVTLLLERGAHPHTVDEDGRDAFSYAIDGTGEPDEPTQQAIMDFLANQEQQSYVIHKLTPGL